MKKTLLGAASLLMLSSPILAQQPNIVLFLVDDMGWQETSVPFWKERTPLNDKYHTPNMEKLASIGMKFTNAYACSVSSPSRVSLMTGANVTQHKVSNWTLQFNQSTDGPSDELKFGKWNNNGLSPQPNIENTFYAKPLPEILRENGYTTMMLGKAHFGAIGTPAEDPKAIGFDYNIAGHAAGAMGSYLGEQNYGNTDDPNNIWGVPHLSKYHGTDTFLTEALTLEAINLVDTALTKDKPFFLYMSHYAVHAPFGKDKRYYQKYIDKGLSDKEAQFAGLIEGMDKSLGDLMQHLEAKGIMDNTIIIFMSDNGGYAVQRDRANAPATLGKGSLFEGGIREPMLVYWNGVTQPNSSSDAPVHIEDFFPTLLEMADSKASNLPQEVDGISFVSQLKGKKPSKEKTLYFHYPNSWGERYGGGGIPQSAIIDGDWKFIYDYETGKSHLFRLSEDISERNNLIDNPKYKKQANKLAKKLSNKLKENKSNMPLLKTSNTYVNYPDGSKCSLEL